MPAYQVFSGRLGMAWLLSRPKKLSPRTDSLGFRPSDPTQIKQNEYF